MSPWTWNNVFSAGFLVKGSSNPGHLTGTHIYNTDGVVCLSNFSLKLLFHNLSYSRKSFKRNKHYL